MPLLSFTRKYIDRSNNRGFQFEFCCDRCNKGYRSRFIPNQLSSLSEVLDTVKHIPKGDSPLLKAGKSLSKNLNDIILNAQRDTAFAEANQEVKRHFIWCLKCESWVCTEKCWNKEEHVCLTCAPTGSSAETLDTQSAMSMVSALWEKFSQDLQAVPDMVLNKTTVCSNCKAPGQKDNFCQECGKPLRPYCHCPKCRTPIPSLADYKYCPKCGEKISSPKTAD